MKDKLLMLRTNQLLDQMYPGLPRTWQRVKHCLQEAIHQELNVRE